MPVAGIVTCMPGRRVIVEGRVECRRCGQWVPVDDFYKAPPGPKNPLGLQSSCIPCARTRTRERALVTMARIDAIKLERGCIDCGYDKAPEALDFDHLPGTEKSFSFANHLTVAWSRIEAEMAKCEVVCANCHRIRTRGRGDRHRHYHALREEGRRGHARRTD